MIGQISSAPIASPGMTPRKSRADISRRAMNWWRKEGCARVSGLEFHLEILEIKTMALDAEERALLAEVVRQVLLEGKSVRRFM